MSTSTEATLHALNVLILALVAGFPFVGLCGAFVIWFAYKLIADGLDDMCWRTRWLP